MGVDETGHPFMGGDAPDLVIEEFADYRCGDCNRAHRKVRRLLSLFPDRIRIVQRNLPMDPSCNPGVGEVRHDRACELARISICAARQGRFWEAHDFLLHNADALCAQRRCAQKIARRLDLDEDAFDCCMKDPSVAGQVEGDIADATAAGIRVTPSFRIGGRIYEKAIPDEALRALR